jgi:hypothetical protein
MLARGSDGRLLLAVTCDGNLVFKGSGFHLVLMSSTYNRSQDEVMVDGCARQTPKSRASID